MNMKNFRLLDCTLRDGGRAFGNSWGDDTICAISNELIRSHIDIVEIGFLWFLSDGVFRVNTTLFRNMEEMVPFLTEDGYYVTYIEFILYKRQNNIIPYRKQGMVRGIRLGILKEEIEESISTMLEIKRKGYQLFVQGINSLSYSEKELEQYFERINEIEPYAVAIVDTYGDMDNDILMKIFDKADLLLKPEIAIDFHSHNNKGQSQEFAKKIIERFSGSSREIILDCTLDGIGMGAGNLATEISADLLNIKGYQYDLKRLNQLSEKYIEKFKQKYTWQWNRYTMILAKRWVNSLAISYLLNYDGCFANENDKLFFYLMCPLSGSEDLVNEAYRMINLKKDELKQGEEGMKSLAEILDRKKILVIAGGSSVPKNLDLIKKAIDENTEIVLLNGHYVALFEDCEKVLYSFISHTNNIKKVQGKRINKIIFAGSKDFIGKDYIKVNAGELYCKPELLFYDSTILWLNLLYVLKTKYKIRFNLKIAGFDGDTAGVKQKELFRYAVDWFSQKYPIHFLTESGFDKGGKLC